MQRRFYWKGSLAPHLNLSNLKVIVDKNNLQQTGRNEDILNLNNISDKWKSFGWNTYEVDGHNINDLLQVLNLKLTMINLLQLSLTQ